MSTFMILSAAVLYLASVIMFVTSKGAIHEVSMLISFTGATVAVGLAGIISRLDRASGREGAAQRTYHEHEERRAEARQANLAAESSADLEGRQRAAQRKLDAANVRMKEIRRRQRRDGSA